MRRWVLGTRRVLSEFGKPYEPRKQSPTKMTDCLHGSHVGDLMPVRSRWRPDGRGNPSRAPTRPMDMFSSVIRRSSALGRAGAALALVSTSDVSWSSYGNDPGGTRYSPVTLINRRTVPRLAVAWTFRTGALDRPTDLNGKSGVREHSADGGRHAVSEHPVRSRVRSRSSDRRQTLGVRPGA